MGGIKSALELAMERSKKYAISDAEREKIKEKEVLQKAIGLFHRYKDGHVSLSEMTREIERMDEKTREKVKETLLSQWVDALWLDDDSKRFLDAIEAIRGGRDLTEMKEKFEKFINAYHSEIDQARERMSLQLAGELKEEGISGDAVEPNVQESKGWQNLLDSVNRSHQGRLDEIKEALRKL